MTDEDLEFFPAMRGTSLHDGPASPARRMHNITIKAGSIDQVMRLVPEGVERYLLLDGGTGYLNVRTEDDELIATLRASAGY